MGSLVIVLLKYLWKLYKRKKLYKGIIMLDNLKSLFATNSMTCLTAVLKAVADLVGFLEQQMQNDPAKVNDAIEQIKAVLDSHKK